MKEFLEDRTTTSSQTRTLGTRGRIRRRTVYIGTVVAMLAMVGGFVLAAAVTVTSIPSTQNIYQGTQTSTTDFPSSPTLAVSQSGNPTAAVAAVTGSTAAGATLTLAMCANSGCTFGATDFDEKFTFTSITTVSSSAANTFTVTTIWGSTPTTTQTALTYSSTVTHTGADTVVIYIDYGATAPSGGIGTIQVVVTGT